MEWWAVFLGLLIAVFAVYTVIPDFLLHRLGLGSWKRQYSHGVVLTFDDGPNPEITPKILDVLDQYEIKGVFFLVGRQAVQYPELVKEIVSRGHKIGLHGENHRYAWGLSPARTWREWNECAKHLEEITGDEILWVRPPWGTFNLAAWWWIVKNKKQAVLWNVEGHDWQAHRTPEDIARRIVKKANEGSIIVLHDHGKDKKALENSLKALKIICENIIKDKKLPFVPLALPQWGRWKRIKYVLFEKWEHFYAKWYKVDRISHTNVLRLSLIKYKGKDIYENGLLLARKGDMVGEIHLDSVRLRMYSSDIHSLGIKALRKVKDSLPELAEFIKENPKYKDIKVVVGLTLIHRGVKWAGFHVEEVEPSLFTRYVGKMQRAIMKHFHPAGKARLNSRLGDRPKFVWMSRRVLFDKWLPQEKA